ncbi:transposase [Mycobacterium sp.]|uniref:transposase n=1 Tax=Mycobacterium sp. TaxID=1785 RepID=UPI0025EB5627|nr:transposase [Mycobacterium sp.]
MHHRCVAEIGGYRACFPTPESLGCLTGVVPCARRSGKANHVGFRWAADKQLPDAVCDFAGDSRQINPWVADSYNRTRTRGHDHPHAVGILVHSWLYINWLCWQNDPLTPSAPSPLQPRQQTAA